MEVTKKRERVRKVPFVGGEPVGGTLVEMLYRPEMEETLFAVYTDGNVRYEKAFPVSEDRTLVPYSPTNNLIRNRIVLFPSDTAEYGSEEQLIEDIRAFIRRYVDVSSLFETVTVYYVLLSWVYEAFNELPYLRIRGHFGSGKTRFLLIAGAIMFRPIFASGASSISPLFRILDSFHGTLLIDEGDFRLSDEKAELVKILNNGNSRGFPVLRSEQSHATKEFNPVAYSVFGPKVIATRGFFQDSALESRFITEDSSNGKLRPDIPINLPSVYEQEALALRDKLLMFRFRNLHRPRELRNQRETGIEPRVNQIFSPLLSMISDERARGSLVQLANLYSKEIAIDRETDIEAQILRVIKELLAANDQARLAIGDITARFTEKYGHEYERKITEKWIGTIVRKKLRLSTHRVQGVFVVPPTEELRLKTLFERYGLSETSEGAREIVDLGEVQSGTDGSKSH